ncbi:DUF6412 domain-containing protein [Embleya scabrispora]|uniref:DUF6412 domain-containing protein n=1 Tax=Embleya scabrispora TaxID=159449 RepID=UPI0003601146|nr:DUF6412 domain-containing protein [Embleya scabrispora]MYS81664.1 hypothetical protein [Streptomyces sp. SID5474]
MHRPDPTTASTSLFATLLALVGFGLFVDGTLPALVAVAVTVVLALACFAVSWAPSAERARVRGAVLREQADRLAFLPSRDPDGPGRSRPRAPGAGSAAC